MPDEGDVKVTVELIYRFAFYDLLVWKEWFDRPDIVVAELDCEGPPTEPQDSDAIRPSRHNPLYFHANSLKLRIGIPRIMRLDEFARSSRKGESHATKSNQSRSRHPADIDRRVAGGQPAGPGCAGLAG